MIMAIRIKSRQSFGCAFVLTLLAAFSVSAFGQAFPSKHINVYVGYAAGATTDLSARALGEGLEKLLGVPIVVENKPGATAGVTAGLIARAKPDGHLLGIVDTGVITMRPHISKASYDPLNDFTLIAQYSHYLGALAVRADSPYKSVNDLVVYAKANPFLSYSSPGVHSQQQLAIELLRQCKGLEFTHIPSKGGSDANNLLLGKHIDFVAGGGQHMAYVKQGRFRNLLLLNTDERDPNQPDVPIMKDIGCQDAPSAGYLVIAPKGLADSVSKILGDAIHKVVAGPEFQKALVRMEIPYDYKDRSQLEKEVPGQFSFYKTLLDKMGVKPE
jgi:tripartite-type tricarboxylate transporter receptor subunit TctC